MPKSFNAVGAVPIGGCIPWMADLEGSPEPTPPQGWEYADGGAVQTEGSPIFGRTKPAMMSTVDNPLTPKASIRGGNTTSTYGGNTPLVTAGSDNTSASLSINPVLGHSHGGGTGNSSVTVNNTVATMQPAGSHSHGGRTSFQDPNVAGNTGLGVGELLYTFADRRFNMFMNSEGNHSHTINQHAHTTNPHSHNIGTNNDGGHGHTGNTGPISTVSHSVEMAWIVRVL